MPGYLKLKMQSTYGAPVAFVDFQGMVFDLEKGSILYIDLAKSNSRPKRSRTDDEWSGSDKKARASSTFSRGTSDSGFGSVHMPGMGNSAYNMIGYPPTQSLGNLDARAASEITASKLNHSSVPPNVPKIGTPCPTLFVANLGPTCTEQELIQVFSRCPGYLKLKMQSTYGAPVAFVDFQDTSSSTAALTSLQGTILYSCPGGLRLEYAKSRMGMPRKPK
ncbi:cell wall integrity protein scw1-like [Pistacia vera]|uniref:cell wall integrity protein scw1-like n=1 Tax=Pistacia vera TaxID=55513 RepID=UPI0012634E46|nr:cell wall integrity protein scw1-like [Pistacia vera]